MDRRKFLSGLVKAMGAAVAGIVGIPALINVLSPLFGRRGEVWQPVGPVEAFPVGEMREAAVEVPRPRDSARSLNEKGVFVWHAEQDEIVVFSRKCTDLHCGVIWDPGSEWFFCPCHGGIFAKNGERMAGPPQRPLYRYENRVRNGLLEIDLNSLPPSA